MAVFYNYITCEDGSVSAMIAVTNWSSPEMGSCWLVPGTWAE